MRLVFSSFFQNTFPTESVGGSLLTYIWFMSAHQDALWCLERSLPIIGPTKVGFSYV